MAGGILERLGRALSFLGVSDPIELRRKEEMRRAKQQGVAKKIAAGAGPETPSSRPSGSASSTRHP